MSSNGSAVVSSAATPELIEQRLDTIEFKRKGRLKPLKSANDKPAVAVVIHGIGGTGKSLNIGVKTPIQGDSKEMQLLSSLFGSSRSISPSMGEEKMKFMKGLSIGSNVEKLLVTTT